MTISGMQFHPHALGPSGVSLQGGKPMTGTPYQHHVGHKAPNPLVRGGATTVENLVSMVKPTTGASHQIPLPVSASSSGGPGSYIWASGA
jgi:hypothetical protein